jgi:hypothetical protein
MSLGSLPAEKMAKAILVHVEVFQYCVSSKLHIHNDSVISDSTLPRRMTRLRGTFRSSLECNADVMRSSVATTCVRVFLR